MPQCSGISTLIFCSGESAFHSMGSHEGRCADWDALGNSQVLLKLKYMCLLEFKESAHSFPYICMFAYAKQICRMKFSGKIGWCQKRARMAQKRIQSQMRPISWGQRRRWSQRTAWERDLIDLTALHRWVFVVVFVFSSSYSPSSLQPWLQEGSSKRGLGPRQDSVHPTFLMVNKCDHNELRRKFRNYEI